MRLTIVVDNTVYSKASGVRAEWGFSAYIHDLKLLYDTGASGSILLNNMDSLGIGVDEADTIFLSHSHSDHTGGLRALLRARKRKVKVVAHELVFKRGLLHGFSGSTEAIPVGNTPIEIFDGVIASGTIPRKWGPSHPPGFGDEIRDDMALYIKKGEGLAAITGCGHAGTENIVEYGLTVTKEKRLYAIIGGLHLMDASSKRIEEVAFYLKGKGPRLVCATHCTGESAIEKMKGVLGGAFTEGGAGKVLTL